MTTALVEQQDRDLRLIKPRAPAFLSQILLGVVLGLSGGIAGIPIGLGLALGLSAWSHRAGSRSVDRDRTALAGATMAEVLGAMLPASGLAGDADLASSRADRPRRAW